MKVRRNNHHKGSISQKNTSLVHDLNSSSSEQVKLFSIAVKMKQESLSDSFIVSAVRTALEFEGVADLMEFWMEESDKKLKNEIIADIQEMIEDCVPKEKTEEIFIKFNDLDAIAKDIRAFKDSLLQKVMNSGGISKLAELTGIPQPSLSRFFNSNSMPRRSTVLKIAKALDLGEIKMDILWSK